MFHVKHTITHTEISKKELDRVSQLIGDNRRLLDAYTDQLLWWNNRVNLVSRGVSRETVAEHIKHSLLLYGAIRKVNPIRIIDTGTGGGLPGVPLAICFPEIQFVLNDIVKKKLLAVKQMVSKLDLHNIKTESKTIKSISIQPEELIITKHAFKVNELVSLISDKPWEKIFFLKGEKEVLQELEGIKNSLVIKIKNLDRVIKSDFYKGKAIVEVINNYE